MENPRDEWRWDQGLYSKETSYIWLGGDKYYESYYGELKHVKLYYDNAINPA